MTARNLTTLYLSRTDFAPSWYWLHDTGLHDFLLGISEAMMEVFFQSLFEVRCRQALVRIQDI